MKCIRAFISGRVQGVFFRDSTRRQAHLLNITGHAINLADGRVEVVACGDEAAITELLEWLHEGPEYAQVSAVQSTVIDIQDIDGFSIG